MDQKLVQEIEKVMIEVQDFPIKNFTFKDVTPIFKHPYLVDAIASEMANFADKLNIDVIVGPESFGFLFGLPLACKMKKPFVLVRKPNKLPRETYKIDSTCEYASCVLEIHKDDIEAGQRVLVVDDFLATGGTTKSLVELIGKCGGIVAGFSFLIESTFLEGGKLLREIAPVQSIIKVNIDNSKSR